jgi:hypothetical protein
LRVGIPNTIREQPIQIGKIWIAIDEETQAFAIIFARPLASPHLPSRIIGVEVRTAECRPTAVWTAFDVAACAMALANERTAIGTWSECLAHVWSFKNGGRPAARRRVNRSLNALFYFHIRGAVL